MPDEYPAAATATDENTEAAATVEAEAPAGPGLIEGPESERELRKSAEKRAKVAETARDELTEKLTAAKGKLATFAEVEEKTRRTNACAAAGLGPAIAGSSARRDRRGAGG